MDEGERKRDPMGTGVLEITEQMKRDMKKGPRQHTVALMQGNRPAGNVRLLLEGEYGYVCSSGPPLNACFVESRISLLYGSFLDRVISCKISVAIIQSMHRCSLHLESIHFLWLPGSKSWAPPGLFN